MFCCQATHATLPGSATGTDRVTGQAPPKPPKPPCPIGVRVSNDTKHSCQ
jgi:hypothetical protein